MDDRSFIARSPAQAFRLWQAWQMVSAHVGLRENEGKVKVVPRKKAWQQQLLDAGFSAHHVVASTRVLGIDFHARLGG